MLDKVMIASLRNLLGSVNREVLTLPDWMERYRKELSPGSAFDLKTHPYLTEIYQQDYPETVLYKSSQAGVSEYAISYALHICDQRRGNVLYLFPNDGDISDFSAARIGPAVEASDYLASIVSDSAETSGKKKTVNRVTLKRVRDNFLYLRGAQVKPDGRAPQLKSIAADSVIFDELDEMDARAPEIAKKRLGHSHVGQVRYISTPTYHGVGIHTKWLESDKREWFVTCQSCNHEQVMTINSVVIDWDELERPVSWHGQDNDTAWVACKRCGRKLNRLQAGRWMATGDDSGLVGYHITKFMSPFADLVAIIRNLQTSDETKRREAYNQDLGEPYKPRNSGILDEHLDACIRQYGLTQTAQRSVMGIDVGNQLHIVVRGEPDRETGETKQLLAATTSWDEARNLIRRYNPSTVVIDALPETQKARELQAAFPASKVWLCYYAPSGLKTEEQTSWDIDKWIVTADRTRTLDSLYSGFLESKLTLPSYIKDVPDYYRHIRTPTRIVKTDHNNKSVAVYAGDGADHFAHAENYCQIAALRDVLNSTEKPVVGGQRVAVSVAVLTQQHSNRQPVEAWRIKR